MFGYTPRSTESTNIGFGVNSDDTKEASLRLRGGASFICGGGIGRRLECVNNIRKFVKIDFAFAHSNIV